MTATTSQEATPIDAVNSIAQVQTPSPEEVKRALEKAEAKVKAAEYAKNYPYVAKDGFYGPVAISSIREYDDRHIVNLCVRTSKSNPANASISFPTEWKKHEKFSPTQLVNFVIENGYISKIYPTKAEIVGKGVSAAKVNEQIDQAVKEEAKASNIVQDALASINADINSKTKIVMPENSVDEALADLEQREAMKNPEAAAVVGEMVEDDKPF
jgi:hypothetical protein